MMKVTQDLHIKVVFRVISEMVMIFVSALAFIGGKRA